MQMVEVRHLSSKGSWAKNRNPSSRNCSLYRKQLLLYEACIRTHIEAASISRLFEPVSNPLARKKRHNVGNNMPPTRNDLGRSQIGPWWGVGGDGDDKILHRRSFSFFTTFPYLYLPFARAH